MRILQLISQSLLGGAEKFALALSHELVNRGHEVRLVAIRDNGDLFQSARPNLRCSALHRVARVDLRFVPLLAAQVKDFRPQIIHAHNFAANVWARIVSAMFPGARVICHEHSGRIEDRPAGLFWLDRLLHCWTSFVVAVSEDIAAALRRRRIVAANRIRRIPVGVDLTPHRRARADQSVLPDRARRGFRILNVASLVPVKNHVLLLDACAQMGERQDWVLLIAGDGPLRASLEERVAELSLSGRVFLLGRRNDIPQLLALSQLFVLSSEAEGMPLSMLEAMASGICPVVPRIGAAVEVVRHGWTGLLYPVGDRDALLANLRMALEQPDAASRMGRAARRLVETQYSIRVITSEIEALYEEALRNQARRTLLSDYQR